jgi:hypothetical protein
MARAVIEFFPVFSSVQITMTDHETGRWNCGPVKIGLATMASTVDFADGDCARKCGGPDICMPAKLPVPLRERN